jgi:hypothetical protein
MSVNVLSLPEDIPWKKLAVSEDMYAANFVAPLPIKWRSSLAVFSYDPVPDPTLSNPDEKTTFLKVIATITGYQPEGSEIDKNVVHWNWTASQFDNWDKLTGAYYPALSALIQVAVYPDGGTWDLSQYPYLTDFEPKKREMVELVSDTGEALTQSSNDLNVRKGTTTTDSTEKDSIDRGGSFGFSGSASAMGFGLGFGGSGSSQIDVGTKGNLGSEGVNVTTTDASREKRESFSHTTSLSQLYQLLDSYHAGMNRAIFFVNARPHIIDSPYTFVNGPRRLEGVQEFFLVVRRPFAMDKFCVKAVLETAHLHESDTPITTVQPVPPPGQVTQTFTGQSNDDNAGGNVGGPVHIPAGYELDTSRGGGTIHVSWDNGNSGVDVAIPPGVSWSINFDTDSDHVYEAIPVINVFDDHVDFNALVYDGHETLTATVFYKWASPPQETTTTEHHVDLYITAREVTNCGGRKFPPNFVEASPSPDRYVSYETALPEPAKRLLTAAQGSGRDAAIAANAVSRHVHDQVISSFRGGKRYAPGAVDFAHTRFALRELRASIAGPATAQANQPLSTALALDDKTRAQIRSAAPDLTVEHAARLSPEGLARRTGLTPLDARVVLAQLMGVGAMAGGATGKPGTPRANSQGSSANPQGSSANPKP